MGTRTSDNPILAPMECNNLSVGVVGYASIDGPIPMISVASALNAAEVDTIENFFESFFFISIWFFS